MPQIELVDVMRKQPARCFCCHTTPTEGGRPLKAIDLGTDHDWGQWTYLCFECVNVICDLWGRVDEDTHNQLVQEFKDLRRRHSRLQKRYTEREDDLKKVEAGKRVERKRRKKVA